jgi:hypothetical protein
MSSPVSVLLFWGGVWGGGRCLWDVSVLLLDGVRGMGIVLARALSVCLSVCLSLSLSPLALALSLSRSLFLA